MARASNRDKLLEGMRKALNADKSKLRRSRSRRWAWWRRWHYRQAGVPQAWYDVLRNKLSCSTEYIMSEGDPDVILCERGLRTFETETRNTLKLSAVPVLKKLTHLPIVVNASRGTGLGFGVTYGEGAGTGGAGGSG